jgi:hypothetical protein
MNSSEVEFSERSITLANGILELEYPILDAFQLEGKIIVLFHPDAKKSPGQFKNLVAVRANGDRIWEAELPTTMSSDAYYRFSSKNPIIADSLSSFSSTIDDSTGRIARKNFYK